MTHRTGVWELAYKDEPKHPWFGTREDLLQLVNVAEESYANLRERYLLRNQAVEDEGKRSYNEEEISGLRVSITAHEPGRSRSGRAEGVIAGLDPRRTFLIKIDGTEASAARFGQSAELNIRLDSEGASLSVASHDLDWASQTFGRLYDELSRARHPWWARWRTVAVRSGACALSILATTAIFFLVHRATLGRVSDATGFWVTMGTAAASLVALLLPAAMLPLFEVLPEGGTPRYSTYLRVVCITLPFTLAAGLLINLATG